MLSLSVFGTACSINEKSQRLAPGEGSLVCENVVAFRALLSDLFDGFTSSLTLLPQQTPDRRTGRPEETLAQQRLLCRWLLGGIFLKQTRLCFPAP